MKQVFILFVLFLVLITVPVAYAADAAYNWTGFYVGLQSGYSHGHTSFKYENNNNANHNIQGKIYGLFAGYNYQFPTDLVVGIEAEFNKTKIKGNAVCPNPSWTCSSEVSWIGSARTRLGYAFDRFIPYIAIGLTRGNVDVHTKTSTSNEYGTGNSFSGWVRGVGLEYAVTNNIIARAEYDYYASRTYTSMVDSDLKIKNRTNFNVAKLGLSYKF